MRPNSFACEARYDQLKLKKLSSAARKRREDKEIRKQARVIAQQDKANAKNNKKNYDKQQMAVREIAQRKLAAKRLLPFIQRFNAKYAAGWVHRAICKRLEKFSADVAAQRSPRLMIFMPPRGGKSEIASKNFPAWHLGRHPDHEIIASSYAVSLPIGFSRKVKDIVVSLSYQQVLSLLEN